MKESAKSPEHLRLYNADLNKATREAIQQALLYLMSKMDYQKIKVTDIVKKAGISRSTFYCNYTDKDAVLQEIWEQFYAQYCAENAMEKYRGNWRQMYVDIFTELKERAGMHYYSIDGRTPDGIPFYAISSIERLSVNVLENYNIYDLLAYEGAIGAVCCRWVKTGMKESIEEMADYGYRLFRTFFTE